MTTLTSSVVLPPATGRAGLSGSLRSEWTKLRSVRSTVWSIAAMAGVAGAPLAQTTPFVALQTPRFPRSARCW